MEIKSFFIYLIIMAGVTYLIRMLPFVIFKGKITNTFIKSFLYYIPYAVLGFREKSLLTVAVFACIAALAVNIICLYI